jgi:hypothetical protein
MVSKKEANKKAPLRYTELQKKAVIEDAKAGMSLSDLVSKHPMGKRAIQRYCRKADIQLKK